MPIPLEAFKSAAVGVDIPEGLSLMMMNQPGAPQPSLYFAVSAKDQALTHAETIIQNEGTMAASERDGRAVYSDPIEGTSLTFTDDKSALFGSAGPQSDLGKSLRAMGGENASKAKGFNPGAGMMDKPFLHVHAAGLEDLLNQIATFGAMLLPQVAQGNPAAREPVMAIQEDILVLGKINKFEVSAGISGDQVVSGFRLTMQSAADAEQMKRVIDNAIKLAQAQAGMTDADVQNMNFKVDGKVISSQSSSSKQEVMQNIQMGLMMAAMQGAGGGF
jgi:hypothetical protein